MTQTSVVTGGAGFIGSNLVHALLDAGHRVRVMDDLSTGRLLNLDDVSDGIELVHGDVRDQEAVARVPRGGDRIGGAFGGRSDLLERGQRCGNAERARGRPRRER